MTMIIAVPTGVKVFNWMFTLYGGEIRFNVPLLWALGFMVTFVIGGMTGVLLAVPPADFLLHNSLFLVAHFHNVVIGGVLFGAMAGYNYWFPKAFGFTLHEGLGKASFWCWLIGFYLAFMPLYALGLMGATRRMQHYANPQWQPFMWVAGAGALVILAGIALQIAQLVVSFRTRDQRRDLTGDPWNGRTLEWSTASPPPSYNYAILPDVRGEDAYWGMKRKGDQAEAGPPRYEAFDAPRNTPIGVIIAFFATVMGFALIWHIWWLAVIGVLGAFIALLVFAWREEAEVEVSIEALAKADREHKRRAQSA
jgi:cytochrome o ubiquinol oxidase subunit 1